MYYKSEQADELATKQIVVSEAVHCCIFYNAGTVTHIIFLYICYLAHWLANTREYQIASIYEYHCFCVTHYKRVTRE